MNRTLKVLITITAVVGLIVLSAWQSPACGASLTGPTADGCTSCHANLAANLPAGHFTPKLTEVKNCLTCHTLAGAAPAFAWTTHQKHFARPDNAATCTSCHQIDAQGHLRLIGLETSSEIKATSEMLAKVTPYYQSWATSKFLDQRHGQQSVTCVTCHDEALPTAAVKKEKCFTCHGTYEQIAERTPFHYNALYSHFTTEPVECNQCHKAHEKSVLACNMCHSFSDELP